jgi:tetratricopeptide (TPR) repeat protein
MSPSSHLRGRPRFVAARPHAAGCLLKYKMISLPLFLLCLAVSLHAQLGLGEGRLKGVVTDEAGLPVAGARIEVINATYGVKFASTSDAKGRWALSGLASAWYKVTVNKEGYQEATIEFQLSLVSRRVQTLDVTLKKPEAGTEQGIQVSKGSASGGLLQEGNTLFNQKEYPEALAKFEEFKKTNPDVHQVMINIGNCFLALKEYARAVQAYEEYLGGVKAEKGTLSGDKDAAKVLATIGQAYFDQGNIDEAKRHFKLAIDSFPGDPVLAYNLGEICFNQGEAAQAIDYLLIAVKIDEKWPPPYHKLGYAYLNRGQYQKALESFKKFLDLAPDDPQATGVRDLLPNLEKLAKTEKK